MTAPILNIERGRRRIRRGGKPPRPNLYWLVGPVALIDVSTPKHPRAVAMVDIADLTTVLDGRGRWSAYQPRHVVYAGRSHEQTSQRMHHVVVEPREGLVLDHRSSDGLDNRRSNLRFATPHQNGANSRKAKASRSSRFKGVSRQKNNTWRAEITVNGERIALGTYRNEEFAAKKYDEAAMVYFGDFAKANFTAAAK